MHRISNCFRHRLFTRCPHIVISVFYVSNGKGDMNAAVSDDDQANGRMGGFDKHLVADPPVQAENKTNVDNSKQNLFGCFGRSNSASSAPAHSSLPQSNTGSKAVCNGDDLKYQRHEPDESEGEYSPEYKRARRQLWVWRIVSYVLVAAVIGELPRRNQAWHPDSGWDIVKIRSAIRNHAIARLPLAAARY